MDSMVDQMTPNGSTNQPIGLVWGRQSLVGGGPFSAPSINHDSTYKQVIILHSDGLNKQDRWYGDGYHTSAAVDNRMYQTGSGAGTCANFKNASTDKVTNIIYTIQVNTDNEPTSTLLQNCASSEDTAPKGQKFYLLTSASQILDVFNKIGTEPTQLRIAK
jgi:hypothetical protein